MIGPGLEPGTFCVLDRCDNQLRHPTLLKGSSQKTLLERPIQGCSRLEGEKGLINLLRKLEQGITWKSE